MTNDVDMDADNTPPGRVTDLEAKNLPDKISVQFTAPGDDLDSNDKAASYFVKYSSTVGNLTGGNFDKEEFNTLITNENLVNSTLDPEVGGATKTFFIKDSIFLVGEKYALALKAFDEKQNPGKVSNIVQIYLPPAPTTTPPTEDPLTTDPSTTTEDPSTTENPTTTEEPTTTEDPTADPTTETPTENPTTDPNTEEPTTPSSSSKFNVGLSFSSMTTLFLTIFV